MPNKDKKTPPKKVARTGCAPSTSKPAVAKKTKPHFRRGKPANNGHPTYIYAQDGDKLRYVGLTHASVTQGVRNIKLDKNPNPQDSRDSYIRPSPDKAPKSQFGRKLKDWQLADSDKRKVKRVMQKDKNKKGKK